MESGLNEINFFKHDTSFLGLMLTAAFKRSHFVRFRQSSRNIQKFEDLTILIMYSNVFFKLFSKRSELNFL